MADRRDPNLRQKLAALIVAHFGIEREHAKAMHVEQILSLVQWDHDPVPASLAIELGWTPEQYNHPTNLTARMILDHREKTATKDIPELAKTDRVTEEHEAFRRRMLAKAGQDVEVDERAARSPKALLKSRGFGKPPPNTHFDWKSGKRVRTGQ